MSILPLRSERRHGMLLAATVCGLAGCGSPSSPADGGPLTYLSDAASRRSALVASLVNPHNDYSTLRLEHYATGDAGDWDRLPEWNPPAESIAASELDAPGGVVTTSLSGLAASLVLPEVHSVDDPALIALGEAAFSRYPAQVEAYLDVALSSRPAAQRYGLWIDDAHGVGGLVRARMGDGSTAIALTCAICHASSDSGAFAPGVPNRTLDLGSAIVDAQGNLLDPTIVSAIAAWGPGRLDVTTSTGKEPVRIPDLRPARWLTYLQQDATVRARDIVALAIRIETLIITSNQNAVRPPRVIALALAAYISSLASSLPPESSAAGASPRGASLFAQQCAACHVPPGLTGDPVALDVVGTDPTLGLSAVRGTGMYRVPSLHGVGSRGPLLHDGTVPSLDAMFDPTRVTPSFTGKLHGTGAVPGHRFGLDLSDADRAALVAYLRAL